MPVKAKFKISSVTDFGSMKQIQATAIYGKEGENADFAKATPWGELKMNVDSGVPASDFFHPGDNVYLTFEKAE